MYKAKSERGRSLVETLAVLVVIAILILASLAGYSFVIHKYKKEKLDNRGVYCYSGCLEGRGFDECGEKGLKTAVALLDNPKQQSEMSENILALARRKAADRIVDEIDKILRK